MEDEILLGYCGRLSKEKGLRYLIEAGRALVLSGLPLKVLLIGDGPGKSEIESFAQACGLKDRILFAGFREEVLDMMPSIDIFVLPSLTEGTPMALLEAMAQGIPVVASAVGEIPAIVNQNQNGILVQPGQSDDVVKAVRKIVENEALGKDLSCQAVKTISQRFGLKPWIHQIEAHYTELISSGNTVR
jgi:glycosyltransferase involved in cell wall biosynthesis